MCMMEQLHHNNTILSGGNSGRFTTKYFDPKAHPERKNRIHPNFRSGGILEFFIFRCGQKLYREIIQRNF